MLLALELGEPRGAWRVMLLRRVSGRPGAEGAPFAGMGGCDIVGAEVSAGVVVGVGGVV